MTDNERLELLAGGPKIPRTHCYCMSPSSYEVNCPANPKHKTTWSEYESRIWCFDCGRDYLAMGGIFDGPIPVEASRALGISFDRIPVGGEVEKC